MKISEELVVDMASDGTIYGIELLNLKDQLLPHEVLLARLAR